MSLTESLQALIRKDPPVNASERETSFTNIDAKILDAFLHQLRTEPDIHPAFRSDLLEMLSQAIALANEVSRPSFDFDAVMQYYTLMQAVSSRILSHAVKSRPRINGYGLTHVHSILPFFSMSSDEAERMRASMTSLPLSVVGVEVIHRSGFRPHAPPQLATAEAAVAVSSPAPPAGEPLPPAPAPDAPKTV